MAKFSHKDINERLKAAMEEEPPISRVMEALNAAKGGTVPPQRGGQNERLLSPPTADQVGVGSPLGRVTGVPGRTPVPGSRV